MTYKYQIYKSDVYSSKLSRFFKNFFLFTWENSTRYSCELTFSYSINPALDIQRNLLLLKCPSNDDSLELMITYCQE